MTRDKTRIYSILHDMHQALDYSDQTYGISESIIQALIMTNKPLLS